MCGFYFGGHIKPWGIVTGSGFVWVGSWSKVLVDIFVGFPVGELVSYSELVELFGQIKLPKQLMLLPGL